MNGVMMEAAREMLLMPPMMTRASTIAMAMPEIAGAMPNEFCSAPDMPLDWTVASSSP